MSSAQGVDFSSIHPAIYIFIAMPSGGILEKMSKTWNSFFYIYSQTSQCFVHLLESSLELLLYLNLLNSHPPPTTPPYCHAAHSTGFWMFSTFSILFSSMTCLSAQQCNLLYCRLWEDIFKKFPWFSIISQANAPLFIVLCGCKSFCGEWFIEHRNFIVSKCRSQFQHEILVLRFGNCSRRLIADILAGLCS